MRINDVSQSNEPSQSNQHLTVALGDEDTPEEDDVSENIDCDFEPDDFAERAWLDDLEDRELEGSGSPENNRHSGITICAYMPDGTSCQ